MKVVTISRNGTIALPKMLFHPDEKVALVTEGSTLIIKKLDVPPASSFATRAPGRPIPLRDIVREVHAYRRAKRAG